MVDTTSRPVAPVQPAGPGRFSEDAVPLGAPGRPRGLGVLGWLRWAWRQLTSMRTALVLLFLLALAAVPGSVVPQRNENPTDVARFATAHPALAPWFDRVGLFSVYTSPWFAAVYLLLFTSLVGCIVPRTLVHARALRSRPTLTPRVLARMPGYARWTTDAAPSVVLRAAEDTLGRRHGFRPGARLSARPDPLAPVAAETGRTRETGNLLFHVALLVVLAGIAVGGLFGYRGTTLVVEGSGFTNGPLAYSDLRRGALRPAAALPPFTATLQDFQASFWTSGPAFGTARDFRGRLSVTDADGGPAGERLLRLNHPVDVDGASISLLGNGYAPVITVRDSAGTVLSSGPVVFLPQDLGYTSEGVVKVPTSTARPGLEVTGSFLPTATVGGPTSAYPDLLAPQLRLTAYSGRFDLGAGSGSVYLFDQDLVDNGTLTQFTNDAGRPLTFSLTPGGKPFTLPNGDTVAFDGIRRWANLQVDSDPGQYLVLGGAVAAVVGLCGSLFLRRRRWWVRAVPDGAGATVVEVAGLDRAEAAELAEPLDRLVADLHVAAPELASPGPVGPAADPLAPAPPVPSAREESRP